MSNQLDRLGPVSDVIDLLRWIEEGVEPSMTLDREIGVACGVTGRRRCAPYSTSVGAALSLIPKGWALTINIVPDIEFSVVLHKEGWLYVGQGNTLEASICHACILAHAVEDA